MGKSSHLCTAKIKVMEMKRSLIVLCLFLFLGTYAIAQRNKMLLPEMRTLTVLAGADGNSLPILQLGSAERLHISFDIMDTEYRRFTYRIEHLTWDFHPTTEIFESDYVRAAAEEEVIEDYEESMNTTTSYAHYWLEFPNERMRPLLAGNYRLSITTEDEDGESVPAAEVYFAVIDPQAALSVNFTTNTDVDWNQAHQQLSMELDMRNLTLRDERAEVKTCKTADGTMPWWTLPPPIATDRNSSGTIAATSSFPQAMSFGPSTCSAHAIPACTWKASDGKTTATRPSWSPTSRDVTTWSTTTATDNTYRVRTTRRKLPPRATTAGHDSPTSPLPYPMPTST